MNRASRPQNESQAEVSADGRNRCSSCACRTPHGDPPRLRPLADGGETQGGRRAAGLVFQGGRAGQERSGRRRRSRAETPAAAPAEESYTAHRREWCRSPPCPIAAPHPPLSSSARRSHATSHRARQHRRSAARRQRHTASGCRRPAWPLDAGGARQGGAAGARLLETTPWSDELQLAARKWLDTFLSEAPDITVKRCLSLFGTPQERQGIPGELLPPAHVLERRRHPPAPGSGAGATATFLAGVEGTLAAYAAGRAHGSYEAVPRLDQLAAIEAGGGLEAYVRGQGRHCL